MTAIAKAASARIKSIRLPIATKLTLSFLSIILLSSLIFTIVGIQIINNRIIAEAQERVSNDLNAARYIYQNRLQHVEDTVKFTAVRLFMGDILRGDIRQEYVDELSRFKESEGIDVLTITDKTGRVALRVANPAPFACYLGMDDVSVAGSSPERFLRVRGDVVETRPIKGTRPRGRNPVEDETMTRELVGSPKDRAENVMIVDLERNDLGRVCRFGSVNVTGLAALEKFPTVYHLTSTVQGRLQPGKDRIDLLRATFPGGSVTGAPKVRSMEIIDELEPTRRGIYTGSIGYLGYSGEMDLNIVIRTFVIKGNKAYFQVGGGIVYDSNPEEEYRETMHKAKGLITALKLAPLVAVEAA